MTDSSAISTTTSSSADSLKKDNRPTSSPVPSSSSPTSATKQAESSWRDKFRTRAEEPGKERWRDASLSDKERWKEWQKAKDKEQAKGSTAGFYTDFYRKKGSVGYWLDMFF